MSAVAINRREQVDHVIDRLIAAVQAKYLYITPEVVYDPPDRVDAWVRLHRAADADEWDEIRLFGHTVTDPAWEEDGILVLIHPGTYRNEPQSSAPPLDPAAVQAAIEAYKSRRKANLVMARMVQEVRRVFPQLSVEAAPGGPECEDGWVTIHVPEMATPDGVDPLDAAHSLRDLVSDLAWDDGTSDGVPLHIHVTHEVDPALNDPALTAAIMRHYQLTEALGALYPLIQRADPEETIEIAVAYYPPAGGDADLILQGLKDEAQLEQIRRNTQDVLDMAQRELGIHIRLERGAAAAE